MEGQSRLLMRPSLRGIESDKFRVCITAIKAQSLPVVEEKISLAKWAATSARNFRCLLGRADSTLRYMSSGENWEKASGAASSKRVRRLRKTKRTLSVGPLR